MNSPDPFEERLRRTPFCQAPASLRREVLEAARAVAAPPRGATNPFRVWLASWRGPHRMAWGVLGIAWLFIVWLNLSALAMGGSAPPRRLEPRVSPAVITALREQRALRQSLLQEPAPALAPSAPGAGAGVWWDERIGPSVLERLSDGLC